MRTPLTSLLFTSLLLASMPLTGAEAEDNDESGQRSTVLHDNSGSVQLLEWGVRMRAEVESYANQNWVPAADDTYYYHRIIVDTRWHVAPGLDLIATPYHAWVGGKDTLTPIDMNQLEFLELGVRWTVAEGHTLHIGRQMLDFGSGRLVSSRMGSNVPRSFDAVRHVWETPRLRLQLFYAREVRVSPDVFDDPVLDDENTLWGAYATWMWDATRGLDVYALGTEQRDDRISLGLRWFDDSGPFDWNVEGIAQVGDDMRAGSVASTLAWQFERLPAEPRLGLKTSISSGDDAGTSRSETFSPLYPRGDYFSETATVGPLNHIELHTFLTLQFTPATKLILETASLWRTSREDAVYNVAGFPLRPGDPAAGRFIGQETSISLMHRFDDRLSLELSGSWFRPGSAVRDTGPADDMLYGKVSFTYQY